MSNESFPSRELLELIKRFERMDGKLDTIIKSQEDVSEKLGNHEARIVALETQRAVGKGYIAGAAAVGGAGMGFLVPYLKSKLGI